MKEYIIKGGRRLDGSIDVQGAKNAALPILTAAAAIDGECLIHNCPDISDVRNTLKLLQYLGCEVKRDGGTVLIASKNVENKSMTERETGMMRSSLLFMGTLLGRFGEVKIAPPGGCKKLSGGFV